MLRESQLSKLSERIIKRQHHRVADYFADGHDYTAARDECDNNRSFKIWCLQNTPHTMSYARAVMNLVANFESGDKLLGIPISILKLIMKMDKSKQTKALRALTKKSYFTAPEAREVLHELGLIDDKTSETYALKKLKSQVRSVLRTAVRVRDRGLMSKGNYIDEEQFWLGIINSVDAEVAATGTA